MADWFTSFAQQAMKLADEIADSIAAQATEAQSQLMNEQVKLQNEENQRRQILSSHRLLPWETDIESRQILSDALMEKILKLPLQELNFLDRSPNADEIEFSFNDFIPVALRILEIDTNLARVHAKLSPKMNEEIFWFNYFCRVAYLRAASGIEGPIAQKEAEHWKESEIIAEISVTIIPPKPAISSPKLDEAHSPVSNPGSQSNAKSHIQATISAQQSHVQPSAASSSPVSQSTTGQSGVKVTEDDLDIDLHDLDMELENMKDIDLEGLDDIDPDDFEEIGASDCMDELEAEIAKELAAEAQK